MLNETQQIGVINTIMDVLRDKGLLSSAALHLLADRDTAGGLRWRDTREELQEALDSPHFPMFPMFPEQERERIHAIVGADVPGSSLDVAYEAFEMLDKPNSPAAEFAASASEESYEAMAGFRMRIAEAIVIFEMEASNA